MLQNVLFVQVIVAIFSLLLLGIGLYFWDKSEQKNKYNYLKLFSVFFIMIAAIGAIYFLGHIFIYTEWSFRTGVIAFIKLLIFTISAFEIILYATEEIDESFLQGVGIFCITICLLFLISVGGLISCLIQDESYNENVIQVDEQRYNEEKYELLAKFNTITVENADVNVSISSYFKLNIEELPEDWTCDECGYSECEHKPENIKFYEIYYTSNNECLYKTIPEEQTEFIPLQENEKPYILIKKYTTYSIDYNQEPPVECNVEDTYVYELHVHEEDIEKVSKILKAK